MIFKYKEIDRPNGKKVLCPAIPVTLIGKETFDTTCILDSGADVSAISKEMAEVLGLDINSKTETIYGVGGPIEAIKSQMIAIIEKGHERYQLKIPVYIILNEFNIPPLLGRTGFFREFEIAIKERKLRIELKKLSDSEYKRIATSR